MPDTKSKVPPDAERPLVKRRGNPNWGKPEPMLTTPTISSFDALVKSLGLSPDEYADSKQLKELVRLNKDQKYVPQDLLRLWGFPVKSEV
jgi:hypothetical protein